MLSADFSCFLLSLPPRSLVERCGVRLVVLLSMSPVPSLTQGRQRDLFPLPSVGRRDFCFSEGAGRPGPRSFAAQHERLRSANQAIFALNQLSGRGQGTGGSFPSCSVSTSLSIGEKFLSIDESFFKGPDAQSALSDLLGTVGVYSSERADLKPYSRESVSWPETGSVPLAVRDGLPEADRVWWES